MERPACFSDVQDTDVPRLQEWCHTLSRSSVKRTALRQARQALQLATAVQSFLQFQLRVSSFDCSVLRHKWKTSNASLAAKAFESLRPVKEDPHDADSKGWFASSQAVPERRFRSSSVSGESSHVELPRLSKSITVKREQEDTSLIEDESQGVLPRLVLVKNICLDFLTLMGCWQGFLKVSDRWAEGIRTRFEEGLSEHCDQGGFKVLCSYPL